MVKLAVSNGDLEFVHRATHGSDLLAGNDVRSE